MGRWDLDGLIRRLGDEPQVVQPSRFATARGSQYVLLPDGSSLRYKAARPEHASEFGWMSPSDKTVFLDDEQAGALSIVQAIGPRKMSLIRDTNSPRVAVAYAEGPDAWRPMRGTIVTPSESPLAGLMPLEMARGYTPHFGNKITSVEPEDNWMEWLYRASRNEPPPALLNAP